MVKVKVKYGQGELWSGSIMVRVDYSQGELWSGSGWGGGQVIVLWSGLLCTCDQGQVDTCGQGQVDTCGQGQVVGCGQVCCTLVVRVGYCWGAESGLFMVRVNFCELWSWYEWWRVRTRVYEEVDMVRVSVNYGQSELWSK